MAESDGSKDVIVIENSPKPPAGNKRPREKSPVAKDEKKGKGGPGDKKSDNKKHDGNQKKGGAKRMKNETKAANVASGTGRRVYLANIPYETKWQEIKDLFREKKVDCEYVHLFNDQSGKPRGCGLVAFKDVATMKKAIEALDKFEYKGRKLVIKEDFDSERDRYGYIIKDGRGPEGNVRNGNNNMGRGGGPGPLGGGGHMNMGGGPMNMGGNLMDMNIGGGNFAPGMEFGDDGGSNKWGNMFGLSPQFLESLNIKGPLIRRIFIANLDYKVTVKKLREVFRLAGNVVSANLNQDKDGSSKGHGSITFEHPLEAVQAISMFNGQPLNDRPMTVKMDRYIEEDLNPQTKLPGGLKSIGMGLGSGGAPLTNITNPSWGGGDMRGPDRGMGMNMGGNRGMGMNLGGDRGLMNMGGDRGMMNMGGDRGMGMNMGGDRGMGMNMGGDRGMGMNMGGDRGMGMNMGGDRGMGMNMGGDRGMGINMNDAANMGGGGFGSGGGMGFPDRGGFDGGNFNEPNLGGVVLGVGRDGYPIRSGGSGNMSGAGNFGDRGSFNERGGAGGFGERGVGGGFQDRVPSVGAGRLDVARNGAGFSDRVPSGGASERIISVGLGVGNPGAAGNFGSAGVSSGGMESSRYGNEDGRRGGNTQRRGEYGSSATDDYQSYSGGGGDDSYQQRYSAGTGGTAVGAVGGGDPLTSTVYVRNLPYTFSRADLIERFSEAGTVEFAKLSSDGVGMLCFSSDREAQRAIHAFNGLRVDGRVIEVTPH